MKSPMYTLRRLLALVLVLVMVGSLFAGCNKKDPDPTDPPEPTATTTQPTDPTEDPTDPTVEPTDEPTEPIVTDPPVTMGTVNYDNLNVRSEPYSTADILKRLSINTRIEIEEQKIVDGVNWGRIAEGWVNLNYVTIDGEGTGTGTGTGTVIENDNNIGTGSNVNTDVNKTYNGVVTTGLHIREDADADSKSVGTYKKGDKVVIIGQRDGWGKTNKGWINMKYVDISGSSSSGSGSSSGSSSSSSNSTTVSNGNKVVLGYGTVTGTSSLNIRTGPGANYDSVGFIRTGDVVSYYQKSTNGWVRTEKGWANAKYLDLEYAVASGTEGTVTASELHVRTSPDSESTSLTTVKKDAKVIILEVKGIWGKIEYETGKFGWINLDYVKFSTASSTYAVGEYVITAEGLNYRKEANADSTSLGTYKKDDVVTVTEIAGNWGKTDKGWINLKYAEMTASYATGTGEVTASKLNVRDKASTSGKDLGTLKKGDKVTILAVSGNWGKIDYNGVTGWVSMKYIEMDPAAKYTVTVATVTGGKVEVSSTSYAKGSIVTVTVTPDSGKELTSLTYTPAGGSAVAITGNKFTMPGANVTINASFGTPVAKYTVTLNAGTGGKVTASATSNITEGTEIVLTVTPDTGYVLKDLTAMNTTTNQNITSSVSGGKFKMPAGNVNIVAEFEKPSTPIYTITSTSSKVTVNTASSDAGKTITLTLNPDEGYVLDTLTVMNASTNTEVTSVTKVNDTTYTFAMPDGNVTVAASFKQTTYSVTITQATGGTVSADKTGYKQGDKVTLTVTLNPGYKLKSLKANSTDITSSCAFTMPGSDAAVTVEYEKVALGLTIKTAENGSVAAKVGTTAATTAKVGETVTLTATPKDGYVLDTVTVKDTKENTILVSISGNTATFEMPGYAVEITPAFKVKPVTKYTVGFGAMSNGTVTADATSVAAGETVKLTATPATGYKLKSLTANGTAITLTDGVYVYDLIMPAEDVTVTATFEYIPVKYKVTYDPFVNIRESADSSSADLGDIPVNTIIESMEGSTDSWIKVTYNSITGWVGTGNLTKQ